MESAGWYPDYFLLQCQCILKVRQFILFKNMVSNFVYMYKAVAGVVGRADLLACSFYILTILSYIRWDHWKLRLTLLSECFLSHYRHVQWREKCDLRHWLALSGAFLCASIAVLCKETAVSALVVCAIYDILKGYNTFSKDKVSLLLQPFL